MRICAYVIYFNTMEKQQMENDVTQIRSIILENSVVPPAHAQRVLYGRLFPYLHLQLFSFPLLLLLKPLLIYPHPDTTFVFFGYLFVYLNLVSVYFTHWNITFCLPPSVIFHFYFTCVYQNVFCFTSLAPTSIFVYLPFFLVPCDLFLFT